MNNDTEQIFILNSGNRTSIATQENNETSSKNLVNLENVEDFSKVCRTCATITEFVIPIFMGEGLQNNLADKIQKHLPIKVSEQDLLPRVVCYQCASTLLAWHELVQCCVQADTALRTRLAAINAEQKSPNTQAGRRIKKEPQTKFKDITEHVDQLVETKHCIVDARTRAEPTRTCEYCKMEQLQSNYNDHLVTMHAELLFHCDECDTYVNRKEFILHMSLHAVEYVTGNDKKEIVKLADRAKRKIDAKNKCDTKLAKKQSSKISQGKVQNKTKKLTQVIKPPISINEPPGNEFSDHSDIEYFGTLPKSVFEAIEDSQGSQLDEGEISESQPHDNKEINKFNDCSDISDSDSNHSTVQTRRPESASKCDLKHKKLWTCPICSKVYTASSSYFYHLKYTHKKCREHECDVCGKKFGTKGSLMQHVPIHTGECRFECKECKKCFRSRSSLYIHEQIHSGVKSWQCAQCHRSFRWRTQLQRHMKRHSAERAHVCVICGRGFNVRCDLLRHARTHSTDNIECERCGVKFAQQRYFKVHMMKKHSINVNNDSEK